MDAGSHDGKDSGGDSQQNNLSQFWNGQLDQAMPPEMREVLQTGKTLTVAKNAGNDFCTGSGAKQFE